ncbi:hypothetical protein N510_000820 [Firmicutes bacterium ASF500]|nr:hypothetical protein N510_000820 [Firmicutes bacterium ASF500]
MRELYAPLSPAGIDPILDFADGELTRRGVPTACRLPMLAAAEELFFAALTLSRSGQVRCALDSPGQSLRLSFRTELGALLPELEELYLPDRLSLRVEGGEHILDYS